MPKHILIVGGGIVGLCTAYYANQRGHRVTVVERGPATHDGCSFGNAGLVVPSHFIPLAAPGAIRTALKWMASPESPFYVKPRLDMELFSWGWKFNRAATATHVARSAPLLRDLHMASLDAFEELARERDDFGLVENGMLILCSTEHALAEETRTAAMARELGMPAEVLDAGSIGDLEPGLRMTIAGGTFYPKDAFVEPARLMASMTRRLAERGVDFMWETKVTGWRAGRDRIEAVRTSRGELAGDEYVVSGGSWSPAVVRDLGLSLPIQGGKGYSLTIPRPRHNARHGIILAEARVAVTPMGESIRFGGTMEIAGLDERINPARVRGIVKAVPKYFPDFSAEDFRDVPPWCGLRPCSPDGLPYVGRFRRYENLSAATGHAMMGVSLAPVTGKLLADVLSDTPSRFDLTMLSPDRYA
jgi:D-amino-acid dehydrogenase